MSDFTAREIQLVDEVKRLKQELEDARKGILEMYMYKAVVEENRRLAEENKALKAMLQEIVDAWEGCRPLDDWNAAMNKAREMLK